MQKGRIIYPPLLLNGSCHGRIENPPLLAMLSRSGISRLASALGILVDPRKDRGIDLSPLKVGLAILLADLSENAAGISHRHHVGGQILGHHASRADYGVITDGDAGENDDAGAQPAVAADMHRGVILIGLLP